MDGIYNKTLTYSYAETGVKGRFTGMNIGDTQLVGYSYDDVGRISGVNNLTFGYLANSNLLSSVNRPNGVDTAWRYESSRNMAISNKGYYDR